MTEVNLKNGSVELDILVKSVMSSLKELTQENMMLFIELVAKCKDQEYQFSEESKGALLQKGLVESDGSIHASTKNIILSALDESTTTLVDPVVA